MLACCCAMSSHAAFAIRREVIEYGALPIASWLGHIDSTSAVLQLLKQLTEAATTADHHQSESDRVFVVDLLAAALLHQLLLWQAPESVRDLSRTDLSVFPSLQVSSGLRSLLGV